MRNIQVKLFLRCTKTTFVMEIFWISWQQHNPVLNNQQHCFHLSISFISPFSYHHPPASSISNCLFWTRKFDFAFLFFSNIYLFSSLIHFQQITALIQSPKCTKFNRNTSLFHISCLFYLFFLVYLYWGWQICHKSKQ